MDYLTSTINSYQPIEMYLNEQGPENGENRILIVDDEQCVRDIFALTLSQRYECITACEAQEALGLMAEQEFALVISDVQMPGLNGVELLRKIVTEFNDVAVIMVSGVDRPHRIIDMLRLGASDYLMKPCDCDVLESSVQRALERRTLLRDGKRYKRVLETRNEELAAHQQELVRLQTQLVHSEKMASLGQLAGGVAHELNNPAGFIYSNMEILDQYVLDLNRLLFEYDKVALSPELATKVKALKREIHYERLRMDLVSLITDCQEGARRIRDIVLNLRTFSRLDEAEVKQVDIHAGIEATIRLLSQYYRSNNITLHRDYGELPLVNCFAGQLNQVWMNLLTNAAQAIGDGPGEVRIETSLDEGMVVVRISDTGKGIAPDDLKRIFDPFFTTKPIGEGTGLGLSISYGIVVSHGGSIKAESALGKGSTFTTTIPLEPAGYTDEHQLLMTEEHYEIA
jgi:two-component system NtrC family sensor kinase